MSWVYKGATEMEDYVHRDACIGQEKLSVLTSSIGLVMEKQLSFAKLKHTDWVSVNNSFKA